MSWWDDRAQTYDGLAWVRGPSVDTAAKLILRALPDDIDRLFDLGCGSGALSDALCRLSPREPFPIMGFDISSEMLARYPFDGRVLDVFTDPGRLTVSSNAGFVSRMALHHSGRHSPRDVVSKWVTHSRFVAIVEGPPPSTNPEVVAFYNYVLSLKEPGRHVFHGHDIAEWMSDQKPRANVQLFEWTTNGNSLLNWLDHNVVAPDVRAEIIDAHRWAMTQPEIRNAYNMIANGEDVLMSWKHCVAICGGTL